MIYTKIMSEMNGKDMYPTEDIYEEYFNFTEKDALNDRYEIMGYDSSNYIPLTGSLMINIVIMVGSVLAIKSLEKGFIWTYRFKYSRILGTKID